MKKNFTLTLATLLLAAATAWCQSFPSAANPRLVVTSVPNSSYANMGLAFLSDGRMLMLNAAINTSSGNGAMGQGYITPADNNQALYLVSGLSAKGDLSGATFTKILDSLTGPPPGVYVVHDTVYVQDRTAFYRVISLNPTGGTAKSKNAVRIINAPTLDSNFVWLRGVSGHQFVFTPVYLNGRFYAQYSGCIKTGGQSDAPPTSTYAGALLSWAKDSVVAVDAPPNAGFKREAGGLRSPNGLTTNGEYLLGTDNQGSFNPGCPIRMFRPGQPQVTYGTRQSTLANAGGATDITNTKRNWAEDLPYQPPLIWVPYAPSASMSQPAYLNYGPYKGDFVMGDVNTAGMGRVHVEQVDNSGHYQASYHMFTGSTVNSGKAINRLAVSPDSALYAGTVLSIGNWPSGAMAPAMRLTFKDTALFEIMAMRSRKSASGDTNGVEIVFSLPVDPATITTSTFTLQQSNFSLSANYGCNAVNCQNKTPQVTGVSFSNDKKTVFVGIATPDTSLGAAHFGTDGVGNNPVGVWGGPGKQDRTLRVTLGSGARSAGGSPLFYSVAYLGWHYQSTTRFDPTGANASVQGESHEARLLQASITSQVAPGSWHVRVAQPGRVTVSLYSITGALLVEKSDAAGDVKSFEFDTRAQGRGLRLMRVRTAAGIYSRALAF